MSLKILLAEPDDFCPEVVTTLRKVGRVEQRAIAAAGLRKALTDYDIVWFRLAHRFDRPQLEPPVRCRILATPVTGLDHIDLEACREAGVHVVSLKGETEFLKQIRGTAELTVALALALSRQLPAALESVRQGAWNRDLFRGGELFGKTAGIVGVGRLGSIVAGYFQALGMDVWGYDPRPDFPEGVARRANTLGELLGRSDLVSIHVNYDESTRHMIGAAELAAMKPAAYLVNTARGGVVDERALLAALDSGRLAGAALDVLDGEPHVPAAHPLIEYARTHANLLITPHLGGNTRESFEKTERFLAGRVIEKAKELGLIPACPSPAASPG